MSHLAIFIDEDGNRCVTRPAHSPEGHGEGHKHCIACAVHGVNAGCEFYIVDADTFDNAWEACGGLLDKHPHFDSLMNGEPDGVGTMKIEPSPEA